MQSTALFPALACISPATLKLAWSLSILRHSYPRYSGIAWYILYQLCCPIYCAAGNFTFRCDGKCCDAQSRWGSFQSCGEPWSRRVPWREGWEWWADSPSPCSRFQQIRSVVKPKARKVPEETCDEGAESPKSFSANNAQKHEQSFKCFKRVGQLSFCRNPCSPLLLSGPSSTKLFTITWDSEAGVTWRAFAFCCGVTIRETPRSSAQGVARNI